jgi:hypothetical protein
MYFLNFSKSIKLICKNFSQYFRSLTFYDLYTFTLASMNFSCTSLNFHYTEKLSEQELLTLMSSVFNAKHGIYDKRYLRQSIKFKLSFSILRVTTH